VKVGWTPTARVCALECAAFIAHDDADAALRWLSGLADAVDRLADFPNIGRVVAEPGLENQREIFYGSYRVRYRTVTSVTVVSVQHTSRQVTSLDVSDP
jgi:plasmid stabilization system protein ParE